MLLVVDVLALFNVDGCCRLLLVSLLVVCLPFALVVVLCVVFVLKVVVI